MLKATNIKWDIDLEDLHCELPTEVEIPSNISNVDDIADWLSDEYGFCHNGFSLEQVSGINYATEEDMKIYNQTNNDKYMTLYQIKQFIEKKEGKEKQIFFTKTNDCVYINNGCPDMYLILDEDVKIEKVEFSDKYGLIINDDRNIAENVLLWEEEVEGSGVSVIGAINGILCLRLWGCEIHITQKLCDEILSMPSIDELNRIDTKFGTIYIESLFADREELERIKIYDSDLRYIDYFPVETLQSCADEQGIALEEEYVIRIKSLRNEDELENLLDALSAHIIDWRHHRPLEVTEFVNHIGDIWTIMNEC